jgi:hypothetical protein
VAILLILAIAAVFFTREEATESAEDRNSEEQPNQRTRPTVEAFSYSRDSARSRRVDRIEKLIRGQFSDAQQETFYHVIDGLAGESYEGYGGDIADSYRDKGLINFYGEMRSALRGSEASIAKIFTTYRAEPEEYSDYINILIEYLGDDFFLQRVQRQPESIQYSILGQIWQGIKRFPLDYQIDGSIPYANSGKCYPKSGELFLQLLSNDLQSDYWQRQKKMKSEQGVDGKLPVAPQPPR